MSNPMTAIIAGYSAAPPDWGDALDFYRRLATVPRAGGLGLAWKPGQSVAELTDLLTLVPPHWTFILNGVSATYRAWTENHHFGLASSDEAGRRAALASAAALTRDIKAINAAAGRRAVLAVEMQSAPGYTDQTIRPDPRALAQSLADLAAMDWDGAAVLVEHCDALIPGQIPAKGFLTLAEEIDALSALPGAPIGLSLNWGRSLLELRDPARVTEHVEQAAFSGLLRAFTFSGACDRVSSRAVCNLLW